MRQYEMFDNSPPVYRSGGTLSAKRDGQRLSTLRCRVANTMGIGHRWWTLRTLALVCHGGEASVSARIREIGNYEKRYVENGLWEYRTRKESQ